MQVSIQFGEKLLSLDISAAAQHSLQQRTSPLYVEMELYFSCMIRKKVRFYEAVSNSQATKVYDNLYLGFRPVMTQQCSIHDNDGPPPVTDFPIARAASFVPHWLHLDMRDGQWRGEFGYL